MLQRPDRRARPAAPAAVNSTASGNDDGGNGSAKVGADKFVPGSDGRRWFVISLSLLEDSPMTVLGMLGNDRLRHIAAAQILEEAYGTLARTQNVRVERVARALRIARVNIRRLGVPPTVKAERTAATMQIARHNLVRLASLFPTREDELRQQVRHFRQDRAARILGDARATIAKSANMKLPAHSRIVYKFKRDARR
jgi:hypothetical protein